MSGEEVIRRAERRRAVDPLFAARTSLARQLVRHDAAERGGLRLDERELQLIELAAAVALVVAELDPEVLTGPPDPPAYVDRELSPEAVARLRDELGLPDDRRPTGEPSSRPPRPEGHWT